MSDDALLNDALVELTRVKAQLATLDANLLAASQAGGWLFSSKPLALHISDLRDDADNLRSRLARMEMDPTKNEWEAAWTAALKTGKRLVFPIALHIFLANRKRAENSEFCQVTHQCDKCGQNTNCSTYRWACPWINNDETRMCPTCLKQSEPIEEGNL